MGRSDTDVLRLRHDEAMTALRESHERIAGKLEAQIIELKAEVNLHVSERALCGDLPFKGTSCPYPEVLGEDGEPRNWDKCLD